MNLLHQYVAYNEWANRRIGKVLTGISDSNLLDAPIISSFPSIRKTVHHIWDAELAWIARLQNQVIAWPPSAQFTAPAITDFITTSQQFADFVTKQNASFFDTVTVYKNSKGLQFESLNADMVMHAMNHSTFHRGQLITMLRQIGVTDIPETDLIAYTRRNQVAQ